MPAKKCLTPSHDRRIIRHINQRNGARNMKLIIGNVNHTNHGILNMIAGRAGYAGAVKSLSDCEQVINCGNSTERREAGILQSEVAQMIGEYVIAGFTVRIEYTNEAQFVGLTDDSDDALAVYTNVSL